MQPIPSRLRESSDLTFAQLSELRPGDRVEFFCRGRVRQLWVTSRVDDVNQAAQPLPKPVQCRSIRVTAAFGHGAGTLVECEWFAFEGRPAALAVVFGEQRLRARQPLVTSVSKTGRLSPIRARERQAPERSADTTADAMIDPAMIAAIVDRVFNRYPSLTVTETETFAIADQLITELRFAGASTRQIELWALGSAEVFLEDFALSIEQRELCASAILRSCGWELARLDAPAGLRYDFLRATRH